MRMRVVGENQDESKWPLYRRRTRQGCYDGRPSTRTTRLSPPYGARWEPSDLSEELRRVSRSECAYCTRGFTKPSIQDATEYVPMDAKSDTDESTRPRGPFLTVDTLLSSFLLPLESDAPLRFNKHTWHCPVFSLFSPFHSQGVAAAKNTA
jgi:hypothetical protein